MSKVHLALVLHNHQPIGNFDEVFAMAFEKSYRPFLEIALAHPSIKFSLHTSGCLFEWLEKNCREYFDLINRLLENNQVELLGGAMYEAILPIIPRADAIEQIGRLKEYIKKQFGVTPRGIWLPERVWEPEIPSLLSDAKVEYLALDDDEFLAAGHRPEELNGYYMTEASGDPVALFPIHKQLRYTIPFKEPQASFDYMVETADGRPNSLFVMGDDGEKFGLWPRTFKYVIEEGWLHRFFEALERESDHVQLETLSSARDTIKPLGRTYLPAGSYFEMGEWVLPLHAGQNYSKHHKELEKHPEWNEIRPFYRGGFWRSFLAKYPESNYLHKRMLRSSAKYHALSNRKTDSQYHTDVLRGQCNCPYWHGVFGGLYLPHLRHAVWKCLIKSEYEIDNLTHRGRKWIEVTPMDYDKDGLDEILIENSVMNTYVSPARGGSIFEWDFRPKGYNLLNTLTRREEQYHKDVHRAQFVSDEYSESASIHDLLLAKEPNLHEQMHFDWWPRAALLDHFYGWDSSIEQFRDAQLADYGSFLKAQYELLEMFTDGFTLRRHGQIGETNVEIRKTIRTLPGKSVLNIDYEIINHAQHELHTPFGVEWNLALMSRSSYKHHISIPETGEWNQPLAETREHAPVQEIRLADEHEGVAVRFSFDGSTGIWRVPIESISNSEGGFEKVFQSVALLFRWELHLGAQQSWRRRITASLAEA